ncbi:hypothetical protein M433DRAFT_509303 [Acidomyces richmondensis BFW]|nr:hypothetical protein M433DRAFT_509303 [Acidomyces richmondensis BFW]
MSYGIIYCFVLAAGLGICCIAHLKSMHSRLRRTNFLGQRGSTEQDVDRRFECIRPQFMTSRNSMMALFCYEPSGSLPGPTARASVR